MDIKHMVQVVVEVNAIYQGKIQIGSETFDAWKYNILVKNNSSNKIQVIGRYWNIVDSKGFMREISGDDVVGERPKIDSGKSFYYSSYANLKTSSGLMYGKYTVCDLKENTVFEVKIPMFSLDSPEEEVFLN